MHDQMITILIFLLAAVGSVALFRLLRLSPVLGYLMAGLMIGPYGMDYIQPSESTATFAEFGIIFLLFMIGLELSIERLKSMRSMAWSRSWEKSWASPRLTAKP